MSSEHFHVIHKDANVAILVLLKSEYQLDTVIGDINLH